MIVRRVVKRICDLRRWRGGSVLRGTEDRAGVVSAENVQLFVSERFGRRPGERSRFGPEPNEGVEHPVGKVERRFAYRPPDHEDCYTAQTKSGQVTIRVVDDSVIDL